MSTLRIAKPSYSPFRDLQLRQFTTSPRRCAQPLRRKTHVVELQPPGAPKPLPYPYTPSNWYKQRHRGLYGQQMIQFGNSVTEKKILKNPDISPRVWRPNRQTKHLYSRALGRYLRLRVTVKTLRTIEKLGGVDHYVAGSTASRIQELGPEGWLVRSVILGSKGFRKRTRDDEKLQREIAKIDRLQKQWQQVLAGREALVEVPETVPSPLATQTITPPSIDSQLTQNVRDSVLRTRRRPDPPDFDWRDRLTKPQVLWLAITRAFNPRTFLPKRWGGVDIIEVAKEYALKHGRRKPPM